MKNSVLNLLLLEALADLETNSSLEAVVDPPLETGEGTDHQNSGSETSPETGESNLRVDQGHGSECTTIRLNVVKLGDHSVSRLRDQSAENTSNVTRSESNRELLSLAVLVFWFSEDISVESFDGSFESDELHDSVWDLSSPEWSKTLVQSAGTFSRVDGVECLSEFSWESANLGGLHSDLDGFEWAKQDISDDFSTGRSE